ncbi:MAG: zinc-ribbon domain-containing protein, partial [Candidatus Azambacteria bacterium]|nr:zinc-ribbon domain-containing protein [Candidatus Azambacteria bacterium]
MFCTKCGKKIPDNATFCTECGKKISGASSAIQAKNKPRYLWLFRILKWIGYPALFFYMFLAIGIDAYYFGTSQTIIAISILASLLLIVLMIILQKYIKVLRYPVMGLLALSILAGLVLLGMAGYRYLFQKPSSLMVTIVKGPVSGASVDVYELDANGGKGDLIAGPLTSDASGNVNFDLPPNLPKRFFIESKGGSYHSEATGQTVQLKDTDILTAVLPAGTKTAAVTPFTHMAAALVQSKIQGGAAPD